MHRKALCQNGLGTFNLSASPFFSMFFALVDLSLNMHNSLK